MRRLLLGSGAAVATLAGGGLVGVGSLLTAPEPSEVGPPPPHLPVEAVAIPRDGGGTLAGWALAGRRGRGVVVVMHGIRSSRLSLVGRAEALWRGGYSVVLFDFQAHGESAGERITFGHLERLDAVAATRFAAARFPGERVGVIGLSLGGAAAVFAGDALRADALVIEAVYSTIERATANRLRMRLGRAAAWLAPLLTLQLRPRLGIAADALRPLDAVGRLRVPVLVVGGTEDRHTRPDETLALYERAPEPKALWMVEGAAHENFHAYDPEGYHRHVLGFLGGHLRAPDGPAPPAAERNSGVASA